MNGIRRTLAEQIAEDEKKIEQLKADLANKRAEQKTLDRKLDVRRKIVLGAVVKAHAKLHSRFEEELRKAVLAGTRPQDRGLFPEYFPDQPPTAPSPTPAGEVVPPASMPSQNPIPGDASRTSDPGPTPPVHTFKTPVPASGRAIPAAVTRPQSRAALPEAVQATEAPPLPPARPSRPPSASTLGADPA